MSPALQASTQFSSPLEVATKGWPGLPGKLAAYLQYKYASFRALGLGQAALDFLAKDRPGYGLRCVSSLAALLGRYWCGQPAWWAAATVLHDVCCCAAAADTAGSSMHDVGWFMLPAALLALAATIADMCPGHAPQPLMSQPAAAVPPTAPGAPRRLWTC